MCVYGLYLVSDWTNCDENPIVLCLLSNKKNMVSCWLIRHAKKNIFYKKKSQIISLKQTFLVTFCECSNQTTKYLNSIINKKTSRLCIKYTRKPCTVIIKSCKSESIPKSSHLGFLFLYIFSKKLWFCHDKKQTAHVGPDYLENQP